MAVTNAMFLFEVVVESVKSLVESRHLIIRSDFGDIFSLELKDPKQMHITMPEPLPLPPEPPGKGKKKPKPKKPKGKKGQIELPPPEPVIQSGQSVLFTSSAEFLIQTMKKCPLELSLWSKEDSLTYIGSTAIPWDPIFFTFLQKIFSCEEPPPVQLNEEYNIFEEGTAKLMAKLGIQVKLSFLSDKITTAFRTLSEDPCIKKVLYTGLNSKTTSYVCTMKTTDEAFIENSNKIGNNYVRDKPIKIAYADYKNASGANIVNFKEGDYCCMGHADKPPDSNYKAPETCPDIDFIIDYVRKIIVSCNDNMRMLTPRPIIKPRIKATDIDRLCYCRETNWPEGSVAERFKNEVQSTPCPICVEGGKDKHNSRENIFDIANIRGPCGKPECKIARDLRAYIENLVQEDKKEIDINDIVGPCGSKDCTLAEKVKQIIRHEGIFGEGATAKGLSTQCECIKQLQLSINENTSCKSSCSKDCENSDSDVSDCQGITCPFKKKPLETNVHNVYYFTVEYDFNKENSGTSSPSNTEKSSKFKYCSSECSSFKTSNKTSCTKSMCSSFTDKTRDSSVSQAQSPNSRNFSPSPADSDIIIPFDKIVNPCGVKSCDMADKVKEFIVDAMINKRSKSSNDMPCYCDCTCDFNFSRKTTYCGVCGGYECLGDDINEIPEYRRPHPCPVYHKLYDKKRFKVVSPWSDETNTKEHDSQIASNKSSRSPGPKLGQSQPDSRYTMSHPHHDERKSDKFDKTERDTTKKLKQEKKTVGKFTANVEQSPAKAVVEKKPNKKYPYPPVPKHMGWNWTAEDIPGMKPRPNWRPGAVNKLLVRRYRAVREGVDIITKKKRAMMQKKKKTELKPTLVVTKRNGEYRVQMEVFKKYSKDRLPYQYPYDEKPPLVYTIGKTEEEKLKIKKQQERRERRDTRQKKRFLQSTFRDKCQEICLKAYNQAIGLLPLPNPNDPECPCETAPLQNLNHSINSCSCSDEEDETNSDTDDDEWTIEFTPPAARWNPAAKHPPIIANNESQYTYLDYKVKLFDKSGNPVPRYFKGPDGKQECSDLGGFWGPGHVWLEINRDGYIGPDNRWVPMNFVGPDGMFYSADEGGFTDSSGRYLKIGIDGYIDKDGKWAWYSRNRTVKSSKSRSTFNMTAETKTGQNLTSNLVGKNKSQIKSASGPKPAQKVKIDKNVKTMPQSSKAVENKQRSKSPTSTKTKSPTVMNLSTYNSYIYPFHTAQCKISKYDSKKLNKYKEIMQQLEMYDDFCEYKPMMTADRASNTPKKLLTPFTMRSKCPKNIIALGTITNSYNKKYSDNW